MLRRVDLVGNDVSEDVTSQKTTFFIITTVKLFDVKQKITLRYIRSYNPRFSMTFPLLFTTTTISFLCVVVENGNPRKAQDSELPSNVQIASK
jgi:hypothetical protein